jgi:cell wall-associated NlpC family hydrolase
MRYQRGIKSSGSGKRARRGAGALACALSAAALLVPGASLGPLGTAAAAAASPQGSPSSGSRASSATGAAASPDLSRFGESMIQALGGTQAESALHALGHALVLSAAQEQIAERERALAAAETEEEEAAQQAAQQAAEGPALNSNGEVANPSEMPAASAGSNGTEVPHSGGGKLFAHTRVGDTGSTAILLSGIALAPPDVPEAVQKVINQANTIVGRPYVWGGGHAGFYSYGYDCSGSVSFALFGGGLIPEPLTSGALEGWGEPGPGKWITVYANAEHTFMEIDGLRWDTVGDARGTGPRWHLASTSTAGFVARHPPGL